MKKNILIVTYWSYKDALVQTYTLPYVRIIRKHLPPGSRILLVTFDQPFYWMEEKEFSETKLAMDKEGIELIRFRYLKFNFASSLLWPFVFLRLCYLVFRNNIQRIHTWCTPAGAIGYVVSKLTFCPLILDSYEPHAETMTESHTWKQNGLKFRILFTLEKLQTRHARKIIAATAGMQHYMESKYKVNREIKAVRPACVDLERFSNLKIKNTNLLHELGLENKIVCVYAGKLGGNYLEKEVFDFFNSAHSYWKDRFRVLLLTSHTKEEIERYAAVSQVPSDIIIRKYVPNSDIAEYIGLADFALTPTRPIPSKRYCTPIKNGEYWAMGLPIVITHGISDDSEIIESLGIGAVLEDLSGSSYRKAIQVIDTMLKSYSRKELYEKIRPVAEKYRNYSIAEEIYNTIYAYNSLDDK